MVAIKQAIRRIKKEKENDRLMELLEILKKQDVPYGLKCHEHIPINTPGYSRLVKMNFLKYSGKNNLDMWENHKAEVILPHLRECTGIHYIQDIIKEMERL